jgi:hypothetical protein
MPRLLVPAQLPVRVLMDPSSSFVNEATGYRRLRKGRPEDRPIRAPYFRKRFQAAVPKPIAPSAR